MAISEKTNDRFRDGMTDGDETILINIFCAENILI